MRGQKSGFAHQLECTGASEVIAKVIGRNAPGGPIDADHEARIDAKTLGAESVEFLDPVFCVPTVAAHIPLAGAACAARLRVRMAHDPDDEIAAVQPAILRRFFDLAERFVTKNQLRAIGRGPAVVSRQDFAIRPADADRKRPNENRALAHVRFCDLAQRVRVGLLRYHRQCAHLGRSMIAVKVKYVRNSRAGVSFPHARVVFASAVDNSSQRLRPTAAACAALIVNVQLSVRSGAARQLQQDAHCPSIGRTLSRRRCWPAARGAVPASAGLSPGWVVVFPVGMGLVCDGDEAQAKSPLTTGLTHGLILSTAPTVSSPAKPNPHPPPRPRKARREFMSPIAGQAGR